MRFQKGLVDDTDVSGVKNQRKSGWTESPGFSSELGWREEESAPTGNIAGMQGSYKVGKGLVEAAFLPSCTHRVVTN